MTMRPDAGNRPNPPVMIDAAHAGRLQRLANAMTASPEVAEYLLQELDRATVVDSQDLPPDVATIGSSITFRDETTGRVQTVTLVLPPDADITKQRVSVLTPIGAALIGLSEGATIDWETRSGEMRDLTVLEVRPPEQIGDGSA